MRSCKQQVTIVQVVVWEIIQFVVLEIICRNWILVWIVHCKLTHIVIFRKVIVLSLVVVMRLEVVDLLMWLLILVLGQGHLLLGLILLAVLVVLVLLPCNLRRVVPSLNRH